jgi:hypothetical protein
MQITPESGQAISTAATNARKSDIPQIPGRLGVIFRLIEARRSGIRSQPPPFSGQTVGLLGLRGCSRCFAFSTPHLSRRRLSHLPPWASPASGISR